MASRTNCDWLTSALSDAVASSLARAAVILKLMSFVDSIQGASYGTVKQKESTKCKKAGNVKKARFPEENRAFAGGI